MRASLSQSTRSVEMLKGMSTDNFHLHSKSRSSLPTNELLGASSAPPWTASFKKASRMAKQSEARVSLWAQLLAKAASTALPTSPSHPYCLSDERRKAHPALACLFIACTLMFAMKAPGAEEKQATPQHHLQSTVHAREGTPERDNKLPAVLPGICFWDSTRSVIARAHRSLLEAVSDAAAFAASRCRHGFVLSAVCSKAAQKSGMTTLSGLNLVCGVWGGQHAEVCSSACGLARTQPCFVRCHPGAGFFEQLLRRQT